MLLQRLTPLLVAGLMALPAPLLANCATLVVSTPEQTPDADFVRNPDDTVTHSKTGLTWQPCALGQSWDSSTCTGDAQPYTWQNALVQASSSTLAGYTDWRLPNITELNSIVETACGGSGPLINPVPFPGTPSGAFWTSSSYQPNAVFAWYVSFLDGQVNFSYKTNYPYVRLVRGGQFLSAFDSASVGNALAIANIDNQTANMSFSVLVTANASVVVDTSVTFLKNTGSGDLAAPTTCTIPNGSNTCTASATWTAAGTGNRLVANAEGFTSGISTAFDVAKADQTITFSPLPDRPLSTGSLDGSTYASASSNLPVSFAASPASICTVSGSTVNFVSRGTCTLTASQAGNAGYNPAPDVPRSFFINQNIGRNDTGQTTCYDAAGVVIACGDDSTANPRQDARYGRDAASAVPGALTKLGGGAAGFDFTALDADGNPTTPSSGTNPHPCVRDNVTGLVWEVKTNDNGLHDQDWTYTWYSTDVGTNGGNPGINTGNPTCGGQLPSCNTQDYAIALNDQAWCGYTDWRMPSARELKGLVHEGAFDPSIDGNYFPNTPSSYWWTASNFALNADIAWRVHFYHGVVDGGYKHFEPYHVRAVRGGL